MVHIHASKVPDIFIFSISGTYDVSHFLLSFFLNAIKFFNLFDLINLHYNVCSFFIIDSIPYTLFKLFWIHFFF